MTEPFRQPFQEAIDFLKQKVGLPSKTWRDLAGRAHDRGFVVAGAIKEALVADLKAAVVDIVGKGLTEAEFRARFEEVVRKHGWTGWTGEGSEAGRAWRARVIYDTNLATAEAAGRYKQMTDPDVLKRRPYWRYRHAFTRIPEVPREHHRALDGLVLRADDPLWDKIYPPNDWGCSCGVENLTEDELKDLGKDGPDEAPDLGTEWKFDKALNRKVPSTKGIGFGWDHAPGKSWAEGLVPAELQMPLPPPVRANPPPPQPPLKDIAKPFTAPLLRDGDKPEAYVDRFLAEFGATRDQAALWRDPAGHALVVSRQLFERPDGSSKLMSYGRWRGTHLLRVAETIKDPDEIWIDWGHGPDGQWRLVRRYLRASPDSPEFASFAWSSFGWEGATAFSPTKGATNKPDPNYLERQRRGALLWRRGT